MPIKNQELKDILFPFLKVWVLEAVLVVRSLCFVEVIHIQLSDERGEVVVLEKSRQNSL